MLACASPSDLDSDETLNTMRWAQRANKIQNVAVRHEAGPALPAAVAAELAFLRRECKTLQCRLLTASAGSSGTGSGDVAALTKEKQALEGRLSAAKDAAVKANEEAFVAGLAADRLRLEREQMVAEAAARGVVLDLPPVQAAASMNGAADGAPTAGAAGDGDGGGVLCAQRREIEALKASLAESQADAAALAAACDEDGGDEVDEDGGVASAEAEVAEKEAAAARVAVESQWCVPCARMPPRKKESPCPFVCPFHNPLTCCRCCCQPGSSYYSYSYYSYSYYSYSYSYSYYYSYYSYYHYHYCRTTTTD